MSDAALISQVLTAELEESRQLEASMKVRLAQLTTNAAQLEAELQSQKAAFQHQLAAAAAKSQELATSKAALEAHAAQLEGAMGNLEQLLEVKTLRVAGLEADLKSLQAESQQEVTSHCFYTLHRVHAV